MYHLSNFNNFSIEIDNITDEKLREMSLIENLQREDLSLIEERRGSHSSKAGYQICLLDTRKKVSIRPRHPILNSKRMTYIELQNV